MENSISYNRRKTDNTMFGLSFHWKAYFEDESNICQFDKEKEHKFQEIKDKFTSLKYFDLYHYKKDINFRVDLKLGIILFNNKSQQLTELFNEEKSNIRLIHFRRVQSEVNEKGSILKSLMWYILGIQYNDKNGNNCKIILQIDENGNFILGA